MPAFTDKAAYRSGVINTKRLEPGRHCKAVWVSTPFPQILSICPRGKHCCPSTKHSTKTTAFQYNGSVCYAGIYTSKSTSQLVPGKASSEAPRSGMSWHIIFLTKQEPNEIPTYKAWDQTLTDHFWAPPLPSQAPRCLRHGYIQKHCSIKAGQDRGLQCVLFSSQGMSMHTVLLVPWQTIMT